MSADRMIPYGRQEITDDDIDAVTEVLRAELITQGPAVPAFEDAVAAKVGARFAVACNSGTAALHAAYHALDVGPGDVVWTSPITFTATANAARMLGADVDFVDIDAETQLMDVCRLADKLSHAKQNGRLPKVVAPVHFTGRSCDMASIGKLASQYGFRIVEDAAHAIGARDGADLVGACRHSHIAIFSFHPVKIITTGEGGLATTNDEDLAKRMRMFCSHGITRDGALMDRDSDGGWYYQQLDLGFNYRLTDFQAALGTSQLRRMTAYVDARRAIARRYDALLNGMPLDRPPVPNDDGSAWHLYVIRLSDDAPPRSVVFNELRDNGIGVQVHYIPVHTQPYYRALGFAPGEFPVSEDFYSRAISLPMFPTLTEAEQDRVVSVLGDCLKG